MAANGGGTHLALQHDLAQPQKEPWDHWSQKIQVFSPISSTFGSGLPLNVIIFWHHLDTPGCSRYAVRHNGTFERLPAPKLKLDDLLDDSTDYSSLALSRWCWQPNIHSYLPLSFSELRLTSWHLCQGESPIIITYLATKISGLPAFKVIQYLTILSHKSTAVFLTYGDSSDAHGSLPLPVKSWFTKCSPILTLQKEWCEGDIE